MSDQDALLKVIDAAESQLEWLRQSLRQCTFPGGRAVWSGLIRDLEGAIEQVRS